MMCTGEEYNVEYGKQKQYNLSIIFWLLRNGGDGNFGEENQDLKMGVGNNIKL